jgi:uncharacterized protein (TIGR02594 family)
VEGVVGAFTGLLSAMTGDMGKNLRGQYRGLPYCGFYLGDIVRRAGYKPPANHGWAMNWKDFGKAAPGPAPGVIAVYQWSRRSGHVGVVQSVNKNGTITLCGGNQGGGRVNCITHSTRGVIAWRTPA